MPISKGDMDMNTESPGSMEIIGMISRKRLKKELKHDEIGEFYLATIQEANSVMNDNTEISISVSTVQRLNEIPKMDLKELWDSTQRRTTTTDASCTISGP